MRRGSPFSGHLLAPHSPSTDFTIGAVPESMAIIWIIAAVIAAVALYFTNRKTGKYRYPPSPPGYNVFKGGHAYLLPPGLDVFSRWAC
jgi:hypothetical protein